MQNQQRESQVLSSLRMFMNIDFHKKLPKSVEKKLPTPIRLQKWRCQKTTQLFFVTSVFQHRGHRRPIQNWRKSVNFRFSFRIFPKLAATKKGRRCCTTRATVSKQAKKRVLPHCPPGSAPSLISPCSPICCDTFPRKKGRDKGGEVVPFVGICEPPVPKCLRRGLMGSRCKYTLSWDRLWVGFPGDQFWGFIQVLWRDSVEGELDWFSPEGVQPRYPFSIPAPPVGH